MNTTRGIVAGAAVLCLGAAAAAAEPPTFAAGPTAAAEGRTVKVAFTASAWTDVEAAVVDAQGRVVRHVAAGLLGPNAPAPLRKDSLAQTLVWDGTDDGGRPVPAGTYRVRVRLGLRAQFGRLVDWEPPSLASRGVIAFDVDEQGQIFGLNVSLWEGRGGGHQLLVWDKEGRYLRTIMPIRRDVDLKRLPGVTFTTIETGQQVPNTVYFPSVLTTRCVVLVRDGRVTLFGTKGDTEAAVRVVRIDAADGSAPPEGWEGPSLPGQLGKRFPGYLAASPDGKTLYVAGMGDAAGEVMNVVCRARWGDKAAATFLGKDAGLNDPRGLATDAQGRLYVCDFNNDRIAVFSPEGRFLKALPVKGPEQVEIDPKTGAAYVYSVRDDVKRTERKSLMYLDKALLKFSGFDDWKEVAALDLPKRARHMHDAGPILALDRSGKEPVLLISYVGRQEEGDYLWKVVDRGAKLERVEAPVPRHYWPFVRAYNAVAVDRERDEVYLAGRSFDRFYRMNARTGELTDLKAITADIAGTATLAVNHPQVTGMAVDHEGRICVRLMGTWSGLYNWIRRYDREGKRLPFTKAAKRDPNDPRLVPEGGQTIEGDLIVTQPSRGYHSGGLAFGPTGDLYVIEKAVDPKTGQYLPGNANALNVYGPEGEFKRCAIPWLSAGAWGPRLDAAGNIYLTDAIRPNRPEFTSETTGSVIQFGPEGGQVKTGVAGAPYVTRRDERDLPPTALEGAKWVYYGIGLTSFGHCVCSASQFDLDGFGRTVAGDVNRHRIKVLDSAGNLLTSFGEYGNRDSAGPMSSVPIPDIPLWEPNAIGVSDRTVFVYDRRNHRILCADLKYAAEGEVPAAVK